MNITYVRWSMAVIEMDDLTIATDPVFRMVGFPLPPRAYTIDQMPRPDLILVSHQHLDHWDPWTMRRLPKEIPLVVRPSGIVGSARRLGYTSVQELAPWQDTTAGGLTITAVPAVHKGGEVGFVIQGERTLYFGGDTAFSREIFTEISKRFAPHVALLPIGGLRFLGMLSQMGPSQAVEAVALLRAKVVVGIHWGGLPHLPPIIEMAGTPDELARQLAEAGVEAVVRGMTPLETVEV